MGVAQSTQAAVLYETGKPLRVEELAIPELRPGQVLVEIAYSGVCRSQLLEVQGKRGPDRFLPHTLGHEGSGIVLDVGGGVTKVKPKDHVVVSWIKGKGAEVPSTQYVGPDNEKINSGVVSTFMRRTVTCESRLCTIPDGMPLREAALLGCAVPTGAGIVLNTLAIKEDSSLAIFGLGGVGLSALLAAKMVGSKLIIGVDIDTAKLRKAEELGAASLVNAVDQDPVAAVMHLTNGRGVDCSIEAAGRSETMEKAFQSVRRNGGICVVAGNLPRGGRISIDPFDLIQGRQLVGSWGGETDLDRDVPKYVEVFLAGRFSLNLLVSNAYNLHEVNQALSDLEKGATGRLLIDMGVDREDGWNSS